MNKKEFKKEMDIKFNQLWEQCIEWKKRDIEHYHKIKDTYMEEFSKDVLKVMQDEYKKVKVKIS